MIVCPNEKITFMNIPKTGTRSILAYFKENMESVHPYGHRINPPRQFLTDEYFIFATIRNPYDRACSYYWSTCRRGGDRYGCIREMKKMGLDNSLKSYLIMTMNDIKDRKNGKKGRTSSRHNTQMAYIRNNNVKKLIHLENIDEEFSALPFNVGSVILPRINQTIIKSIKSTTYIPRPPAEQLAGKEEIEMINEMYWEDFEAFPEYERR